MQKFVLDHSTQSALEGAPDEIELCDDTGRTVGYFVTPEMHKRLYRWAASLFDDPEELEAARRETETMTTAEAIAYAEKVAEDFRRERP